MKKIALILVLFAVSFMVGCDDEALSLSDGDGMMESREDRQMLQAAINDLNARQIQDDCDLFWLYDSNCKLTEWQIYLGK